MTSWIAAGVSLLLLAGGGATAYSDLHSDLAKIKVIIERNKDDITELDRYDIHLTENIDTLKGKSIRTESDMTNLQRTTEKLEATSKEMLKELRRMNDNLIRMSKDGGS